MAAEKKDQQDNQQNEIIDKESAEGGGAVQDFIETNKKIVQYIGGGIGALILLVYFGYTYYVGQNEEAQVEMFPAVFYFEKDSLNLALNGDGSSLGFVDIVDDYSLTKAGNLAKFYAGACNLKLGNFEEAIDYLDGFSGGDVFVQARAYCMMGDAYTEMDDTQNAIKNYEKASDYKPNKSFTPMYLMKLGLAFETANRWEDAAKAYNRIVKEFPTANEINDAKKFKARAEIEMTNT